MQPVAVDAKLAELAFLDVLDVTPGGRLVPNAEFIAACRALYQADPAALGDVFERAIVARAAERGYACLDAEALALAALEVAADAAAPFEA